MKTIFTLDISNLKDTSLKNFRKFFLKKGIILKKFCSGRRIKIYVQIETNLKKEI
jgi:hypothetical protein